MKRPLLPDAPIPFERLRQPRWAKVIAFREPLKGEYFLGGAIVEAYVAYNDHSSGDKKWIVEPLPLPLPEPPHLHQYKH